jgi:hypothetical protein
VWIAPLVAGVYYLALRGAFARSIGGMFFDASDIDLSDVAAPQWGSHWIYRIFAEAVSLAFGLFVAAGVARQRAKAAAMTGALAIAAVYLLINMFWLYFVHIENSYVSIEPWYQHLVKVAIILGAPFIGSALGKLYLNEIYDPNTTGFAGINRLHFLWLWFAASLYAAGTVAPLINWTSFQLVDYMDGGKVAAIIHTILWVVPVFSLGVPAHLGLVFLSGNTGCSRTVKNIVGPTILGVGLDDWYMYSVLFGKTNNLGFRIISRRRN